MAQRRGPSYAIKRIENEELGGATIADFAEPVPGDIWIATSSTLVNWNNGRWRRFQMHKARQGVVCEIAIARDGTIWVDGSFGGIARVQIKGDRVTRIEGVPFTANDAVYYVSLDSRGWVWAGTDHGLVVLRGTEVQRFTERTGLLGNDQNE